MILNLQVIQQRPGFEVACACFDEGLGFTCDVFGRLQVWDWASGKELGSSESKKVGAKALIPAKKCGVFAVFCSQVHAYLWRDGRIIRVAVLEARIGCACRSDSELVIAAEDKIQSYSLRWAGDTLRLPKRLQIVFSKAVDVRGLVVQKSTLFAVADGGLFAWREESGAAVDCKAPREALPVVGEIARGEGFVAARVPHRTRLWRLADRRLFEVELAGAMAFQGPWLHVLDEREFSLWTCTLEPEPRAVASWRLPHCFAVFAFEPVPRDFWLVLFGKERLDVAAVLYDESPRVVGRGNFIVADGPALAGPSGVSILQNRGEKRIIEERSAKAVALGQATLAVAREDGVVVVYDRATLEPLRHIYDDDDDELCCATAVSSDGAWRGLADGRVLGPRRLPPHAAKIVVASPRVVVSADGDLRIWGDDELERMIDVGRVTCAKLLEKQQQLALGTADFRLEIWSLPECLRMHARHERVDSIAAAPLLTSGPDGVVRWLLRRRSLVPAERFVLATPPRAVTFFENQVLALLDGAVVELGATGLSDRDDDYFCAFARTTERDAAAWTASPTEDRWPETRAVLVGGREISGLSGERAATTAPPPKKRERTTLFKQPLAIGTTSFGDARDPRAVQLAKAPRVAPPPNNDDDVVKTASRKAPALPGTNAFRLLAASEPPSWPPLDEEDSSAAEEAPFVWQLQVQLPSVQSESLALSEEEEEEDEEERIVPPESLRRFHADLRTLELAPSVGLCAMPKTTTERVQQQITTSRAFGSARVVAVPSFYWRNGEARLLETYGLRGARRWRVKKVVVEEKDLLEEELAALKDEERRGKRVKPPPLRGIRGFGFGTCRELPPDENDENIVVARKRRERIRELESSLVAAWHDEVLLPEKDKEKEKKMEELPSANEEECEKKPRELAFQKLLGSSQNRGGLLAFARLATWAPCVYARERLGVRRIELCALWRACHKNTHGGNRGSGSDFEAFATALEDLISERDLGPRASLRLLRCEATEAEVAVELDDDDTEEKLARARAGRDQKRGVALAALKEDAVLDLDARPAMVSRKNIAARCLVVVLKDLEPATNYCIYAVTCGQHLAPHLRDEATRRALDTMIKARTAEAGATEEERIQIPWAALSPEQQRTELLAALKSKDVCAAARAQGLEVPDPKDARGSIQKNDVAAEERWKAWRAWWPLSFAREAFVRREIVFAAKQSDQLRAMAAAEGAEIEMADILLAQDNNLDDPVRKRRWTNFQRWYCGMPVFQAEQPTTSIDQNLIEPRRRRPPPLPPSSLKKKKKQEEEVVFVASMNRRAEKPGYYSAASAAAAAAKEVPRPACSSKNKEHVQPELPLQPGEAAPTLIKDKASFRRRRRRREVQKMDLRSLSAEAERGPVVTTLSSGSLLLFRMAALDPWSQKSHERLAMRNEFLNARTTKVTELRAAVEKTKQRETSTRLSLNAVAKMIMFQLRMQKALGGGEEKLDEIDIFAEVDETALLLDEVEKTVAATAGGDNAAEEEATRAPEWESMSDAARRAEVVLACVVPRVIERAIEALVAAPEPEAAWLGGDEIFASWYSRSDRADAFAEETRSAWSDPSARREAADAGVASSRAFRAWYARALSTREAYLTRIAERVVAARRGLSQFDWGMPLELACVPPTCAAREPAAPQRYYRLYPSRSREAWSAADIARWYDEEDGAREFMAERLGAWSRAQWARDESARRARTRRDMAREDERSQRMRATREELLAKEDAAVAIAAVTDASSASDVVGLVGRLIYSPALDDDGNKWDFIIPTERRSLLSGLSYEEDLDDARRAKRLAAEVLVRDHQARMKRREEERKQREEAERRHKEDEDRRRLVDRAARERRRLLRDLDATRARKAIARARRRETLDEGRRRTRLEANADAARAVVAIANAVVAPSPPPAKNILVEVLDASSPASSPRRVPPVQPPPEKKDSSSSEEENSSEGAFFDDDAFARALDTPVRSRLPRRHLIFENAVCDNRNPDVLPGAKALARHSPEAPIFVLAKKSADQIVEALRLRRLSTKLSPPTPREEELLFFRPRSFPRPRLKTKSTLPPISHDGPSKSALGKKNVFG